MHNPRWRRRAAHMMTAWCAIVPRSRTYRRSPEPELRNHEPMPAPYTRRTSFIAALLVLTALAGCGKKDAAKEDKGGDDAENAAVPVQVAAATRGPIDRVIRAEAILYPINQANVMPKISAPVRR